MTTLVETLHILNREAVDSEGRVLSLSDSQYVGIRTTQGFYRFEVMPHGWLKLHADLGDSAARLIHDALMCQPRQSLSDEENVATIHSDVIETTMSRIAHISDESWAAKVTSYTAEGPVTQSNRISASMLLAVSPLFGTISAENSPEVFLGVTEEIFIYPA